MFNKSNQSKIFEFKPDDDITVGEILELVKLIRIGVPGNIYDEASDKLKKHLIEIKESKNV